MKSFIFYLPFLVGFTATPAFGHPAKDLLRDIRESKIARIEVVHAPEDAETSHAVDPRMLMIIATQKITVTNLHDSKEIALLMAGLEHAKTEPVPLDSRWGALKLNLRWGAVFYDARSQPVYELYLDSLRARGTIQNQPYQFQPELARWFTTVIGKSAR